MAITKLQAEALNLADTYAFTGTVTGAGGVNTPAFQAYLNSDQNVSSGTQTKVACANVRFDTASCYDTSNYRFTPNVAGKYFVYGKVYMGCSSIYTLRTAYALMKKNTSEIDFMKINLDVGSNNGTEVTCTLSSVVDMNGSSDYFELYGEVIVGSGTPNFKSGVFRTGFGAYKIIE